MEKRYITKKQLKAATTAPGYIIDYLRECNRLPIVHQAEGPGYGTLYHPDAVQVVKEHLLKGDINCSHNIHWQEYV